MATKARFFTFIVYPESAPDNWRDLLRDSLRQFLLSPLHTPDPVEDWETGAIKVLKEHHHGMMCAGNTITAKAAREILSHWEWIVMPPSDHAFMVGSYRNLSRYFVHLDQPDKQQFPGKPEEQLECLNNFPLDLSKELTKTERRQLKIQLWNIVRDNNVTEYYELLDALGDSQEWDMFELAFDSQSKIEGYIRSRRESFKQRVSSGTDSAEH